MRILALAALVALPVQEEFLPLKEGTRWTYAVEDRAADAASTSSEVVSEVAGARAIGEAEWTEVTRFLGYRSCWIRCANGAIEMKAEATETAPILPLLKLPAKPGDTWTGTLGRDEVRFTVGSEEEVETATSRVRALHVSFTVTAPEKHAGHAATKGDLWFASGTGIVRAQVTKDLDCHSAETKVYLLKS